MLVGVERVVQALLCRILFTRSTLFSKIGPQIGKSVPQGGALHCVGAARALLALRCEGQAHELSQQHGFA
jgi:hypothetical protein